MNRSSNLSSPRAPRSLLALALLSVGLLSACGGDPQSSGSTNTNGETCDPGKMAPTVAWKRTGAVLSDLGRALSLAPDEVCSELGDTPCSSVHRVALGENDPFDRALYKPFAEPLGTTPLAAERAVLHACIKRVELDRAAAAPVVFTHLSLDAAKVDDTTQDGPFAKDAAELGRRLLSRELTAEEVTVLTDLALDDSGAPVSASDAATLACFTLGTSREFLFF